MNIVMISTDRKVFEEGSAVRSRIIEYGALVDKLTVIVFAKKELGLKSEKIAKNVELRPTNSTSKLACIGDAIRIGKELKDIDIVSTQDPFETALVGKSIAEHARAKLQIQIHTDFVNSYFKKESLLNKFRTHFAKIILSQADCIRVVSKRIYDSLSELGIRKYESKTTVLPIFIDRDQIENQKPAVDLHKKYSQFETIILMASRLEKEKNVLQALSVMRDVVKKYPKTGLVIVGSGGELKKLQKKVAGYNLQTNVIFEEWNDDIISYYKTADIFLLTSNYEGYGMSLVEATFSGLPVVTTDVGVARELKECGGLVCDPEDGSCISENLIRLIENPKTCEEIARRGRKALHKVIFRDKAEYLKKYKKGWEECT